MIFDMSNDVITMSPNDNMLRIDLPDGRSLEIYSGGEGSHHKRSTVFLRERGFCIKGEFPVDDEGTRLESNAWRGMFAEHTSTCNTLDCDGCILVTSVEGMIRK